MYLYVNIWYRSEECYIIDVISTNIGNAKFVSLFVIRLRQNGCRDPDEIWNTYRLWSELK